MTTTTLKTLDQLIAQGEKHARKILLELREPELQPLYHLINAKGEGMLVPCRWTNDLQKDLMLTVVRQASKKFEAVQALYLAEAWMLIGKKVSPNTSWHVDRELERLGRPSESPDRIEVVQLAAMDADRVVMQSLQMLRDKPGGRLISLVKMEYLDTAIQGQKSQGRMIDGIITHR